MPDQKDNTSEALIFNQHHLVELQNEFIDEKYLISAPLQAIEGSDYKFYFWNIDKVIKWVDKDLNKLDRLCEKLRYQLQQTPHVSYILEITPPDGDTEVSIKKTSGEMLKNTLLLLEISRQTGELMEKVFKNFSEKSLSSLKSVRLLRQEIQRVTYENTELIKMRLRQHHGWQG